MFKALLFIKDNQKHENYKDRVEKVIRDMNFTQKNIDYHLHEVGDKTEANLIYYPINRLPALILFQVENENCPKELFRWEGVYTTSSLWWKLITYVEGKTWIKKKSRRK